MQQLWWFFQLFASPPTLYRQTISLFVLFAGLTLLLRLVTSASVVIIMTSFAASAAAAIIWPQSTLVAGGLLAWRNVPAA